MGFKIGGTAGKLANAAKKTVSEGGALRTNVDKNILGPFMGSATNAREVITGKKSLKEGIKSAFENELDKYEGLATLGHGRKKNPADGAVDPALEQRNIWQGMRDQAISDYKGANLGYSPYLQNQGPELQAMNYNPYRTAATNQAASQAQSQYQGLLSNLQTSGGVSASDRMGAMQNFNRQKIMGQLGAGATYDKAQSGANLDAGMFNQNRAFGVAQANVGAQNAASKFNAGMNQQRTENLYQGAIDDRNLGRQLEASNIIAQQQLKPGPKGLMDNLYGRVGNVVDYWR